MGGFPSLRHLITRDVVDGASVYTAFRKTPAVVTASGFWMDLSMAPGNPRPNYYASTPLVAAQLAQSTDGGLFHGAAVAPSTKHLRRLMAMTITAGAVPLPMILCDYLLYYPFVDESAVGEEQPMTNSVTIPRYTDGAGVQMFAVCVAPHVTGTGTFITVSYTNQDGTAGRTSQTVQMSTQLVNGTIIHSANARQSCRGPFIPLQSGDTGVRSVQSVTMSGLGDVGLFTLVLVRPLADISLRGIDAPVEVDFLTDKPSLPRIYDDAYLNFLALPSGSLSAAGIFGEAFYTWSS